jgi:hypothetical protein
MIAVTKIHKFSSKKIKINQILLYNFSNLYKKIIEKTIKKKIRGELKQPVNEMRKNKFLFLII